MHDRKRFSFSLFCCVTLFLQACVPVSQYIKKELPPKIIWNFYLQPYQKTQIYLNQQKITPIIQKKNKSIAYMKYEISSNMLSKHISLEAKNKRFESFRLSLSIFNIQKKLPKAIILNPKNSITRFYRYLNTGKQPKSVRFINNTYVFLALLDERYVQIFNIHTGDSFKLQPSAYYAKKKSFVESIVLHKKQELWVSQMTTGGVHVFDLNNKKWKNFIPTVGSWSKVLFKHPTKDIVFLSNWLSKNISIIDTNSYKEIKTIPTWGTPRGMFVSKKNQLYIALYGKNKDTDRLGNLIQVDLNSSKLNKSSIKNFDQLGAKRHLTHNKKKRILYLSDMSNNYISVFDLKKQKILKRISVYSHPNTIVYSNKNKLLFVSSRGENSSQGYLYSGKDFGRITLIETKNHTVIQELEAGNQPTGLDVSPNGKYLATTDFLDHKLRVYKINRFHVP